MPTIAIAFDPDGSIEFTRNKNLDEFFGGAGRMKRVTDIRKLLDSAHFYIWWLMGPYKNRMHTVDHDVEIFGLDHNLGKIKVSVSGALLFRSYDEAVAYEIECLNKMRENGVTFDGV